MKDIEMLVLSGVHASGSVKRVNKSEGKDYIPDCTFKNKEQATKYDLVGCLDEHAIEAWSTKKLWITSKVVGALTPIHQ